MGSSSRTRPCSTPRTPASRPRVSSRGASVGYRPEWAVDGPAHARGRSGRPSRRGGPTSTGRSSWNRASRGWASPGPERPGRAGCGGAVGQTQAQQGFTTAEYNLSSRQYPEQLAQAAQQNKEAVFNQYAQAAASGRVHPQGPSEADQNQALQYGWQQQDINRNAGLAALGQQAGLSATQYSLGDIARSEQNLQLTAAANGLSVEQLKSQYANQVAQTNTGARNRTSPSSTRNLCSSRASRWATSGQQGRNWASSSPGQITCTASTQGLNLSSLFSGNLNG